MRAATEMKMSIQRMICTGCGAEANASCNCGKAYMPAKQRAAEAIAANPQKSNRAIAEEIGVNQSTVSRARSGVADATPEREGRDGKVYRLQKRDHDRSEMSDHDLAATLFKVGTTEITESAQEALSFVRRMSFSRNSAMACVAMVDRIIAEWSAVKIAIQRKGEIS